MDEIITKINEILFASSSINPIELVQEIMKKDFIVMHGPIHHYLDGACLMTCYYNQTKAFDLKTNLSLLADRAKKMPGAMCGQWGVCGSSASLGAALSIIHGTGPLSSDQYYQEHMELTSRIIVQEGKMGGPRCCKRNGYTALLVATQFVKEKYHIELESSMVSCEFSAINQQCLHHKCPYYKKS